MTSTETGTSWSDRLSPRNWSLAWKLVAVGLIPAVLAIVLGVLRVADQAHTASQLGAANRLLEVRGQVADAATALRAERDRATTYLADRRQGDRGPLQQAVRDSDAAIERFRTGVPAASDLDQATRTAFEQAQGGFAQLPVLRAQVDGSAPELPADIMQSYNGVVARTDVLDRALLRRLDIPDVGGLIDALTAATAGEEAVALQHTVLGAALRAGTVSPADRAVINATDNAFVAAYTEYQVALPVTQTPVNFITSRANAQRDADKATILSAPAPGPISMTADQWDNDSQAAGDRVADAATGAAKALADAGNAAEARSSNLAGLNSVLLMLGVLAAATIVVLMSRSLTRSLRILRTSALEIAGRRLPHAVEAIRSGSTSDVVIEPVPLHTRDEIGEVARAFDEVHDQALRLAADQAALQNSVSNMFVNLSRRSQGLVERQLQLIEQLESNEQDPDQLSNLFQLDHLATRMRRNSENLLVLAGTDFAKRNVAPVPLVDVLRAAVSEIEHYQRVVVQAPPQATIVGRSTSDIVHLLAELLDNATSFSPPDSQVIIGSHRTADGSILVEIADRGVGMPDQELTDANRRLSTPSSVDVSASRRMGLYVVGRLGTRHGITVHLGGAPMGGGPGGGLTASVTLPAHLVVSAGEGGGRAPRPDGALAPAASNGVPPQRAGQLGRPTPRAALAVPGNGQAFAPASARNGLPTRTPGSSLRRDPAQNPLAAADPSAAEQINPFGVPAQPAARAGDGRGREEEQGEREPDALPSDALQSDALTSDAVTSDAVTSDALTSDALTTGALPTGAVPAVAAGAAPPAPAEAERAEERATDEATTDHDTARDATPDAATDDAASDDSAETPPSGQRAGQVSRGGWSVPERAVGTAPTADSDGAAAEATTADGVETDDATGRAAEDVDAVDGTGSAVPAAERGQDRPDDAEDLGGLRPAAPRPRPTPGPGRGSNGTYRDLPVPATPYGAFDDGVGQNGAGHVPGQNGSGQYGADPTPRPAPHTTPLPVVPDAVPAAAGPDYDGVDALFSASVPAIAEPDGLPRSRRPLGELTRGPVDLAETTPIFEEIASAWFASHRPVPVDWELGHRPGAETEAAEPAGAAPLSPSTAAPFAPAPAAPHAPATDEQLGYAALPERAPERRPAPGPSPSPVAASAAPAARPPAQAFATAADEGWRAASGAASERPDELTSAGLPKRRPRARLVPGSAGSAVLAAPASPTRSAESVRGRLASYQQGVRQGREIRLRRDPEGPGSEPDPTGESTAASAGGGHDEENR